MSKSGGKPSGDKLASLIMSVNRSAHSDPKTTLPHTNPPTDTAKDSYAQRLAREHHKILGVPSQEDNDLFKQFIDPPETPVLKLEASQLQTTQYTQKPLSKADLPVVKPKDIQPEKLPHVTKTNPPHLAKDVNENIRAPQDQNDLQDTHGEVAARRTLPFSEESHVRVKVIIQDIDMNIGHIGAAKRESITWLPRDAIKHYLAIQNIERRRAATKGAVYRTFQHDA